MLNAQGKGAFNIKGCMAELDTLQTSITQDAAVDGISKAFSTAYTIWNNMNAHVKAGNLEKAIQITNYLQTLVMPSAYANTDTTNKVWKDANELKDKGYKTIQKC